VFFNVLKNQKKRKQRMKREEYDRNKEVKNIEEKLCFWVFKTNRKKR